MYLAMWLRNNDIRSYMIVCVHVQAIKFNIQADVGRSWLFPLLDLSCRPVKQAIEPVSLLRLSIQARQWRICVHVPSSKASTLSRSRLNICVRSDRSFFMMSNSTRDIVSCDVLRLNKAMCVHVIKFDQDYIMTTVLQEPSNIASYKI